MKTQLYKLQSFSGKSSSDSTATPATPSSSLGTNETALIGAGIGAAGGIVESGLGLLQTAGDAATGGLGAILGAVSSVITSTLSAVTDIISANQQAITQRRAILAETMGKYFSIDTNKHSNLGFVIAGALVLGGLLYIAAIKKK